MLTLSRKLDNRQAPRRHLKLATSDKNNRQENLQKIKRQKNISQEFLNELEKDIELIHNFRLKFSVHESTGRTMVRVISKDTGKTIREVPSETILNMAAKIDEITGMLSDDTV